MIINQQGSVEVQRLIKDLMPGEGGWTVPWAAEFDEDGNVVELDENFSIHDSPGGTLQMFIVRIGGGYNVDVSCIDSPVLAGRKRTLVY